MNVFSISTRDTYFLLTLEDKACYMWQRSSRLIEVSHLVIIVWHVLYMYNQFLTFVLNEILLANGVNTGVMSLTCICCITFVPHCCIDLSYSIQTFCSNRLLKYTRMVYLYHTLIQFYNIKTDLSQVCPQRSATGSTARVHWELWKRHWSRWNSTAWVSNVLRRRAGNMAAGGRKAVTHTNIYS